VLRYLLVDAQARALIESSLVDRRRALEAFAQRYLKGANLFRLSPATNSLLEARRWLTSTGGALDGIVAKRRDLRYRAGLRDGMQKIKNQRTVDCVVGGFRYNEGKPVVGSLLLGLYDDQGKLNHVGFTSSLATREKPALTAKLRRLTAPPGFTGAAPGGPSRWSTERSTAWEPLKHELVVEVSYDHFSGGRFRHGTRLLRWRPDKSPRQCTMDRWMRLCYSWWFVFEASVEYTHVTPGRGDPTWDRRDVLIPDQRRFFFSVRVTSSNLVCTPKRQSAVAL
jgi:ATP-dependent DNA ligase